MTSKLSKLSSEFEYIEYEEGGHALLNYGKEYKEKINQWIQQHIDY
ncbi:hypothetical protein [Halobacillus andaensis]